MPIFPDPLLLLHVAFDGLANVLENHTLYPVWARGSRLTEVGKKRLLSLTSC